MPVLGDSGLDVHPLCLGGNVFGWTADEDASFAVLDAYVEGGGNFIDTADVYSVWVDGHTGGESEAVLGRWMAARGNRDDVIVATKVGMLGDGGLAPDAIRAACDASLERLQTDRIDLYYAHRDDADTPVQDTLGAFDALVREGKVRALGASNFDAGRLAAALEVSERDGLAAYTVLQPGYNLLDRSGFEGPLRDVCAEHGLAAVPYFGLARGFLSGKYREGGEKPSSPRAGSALREYGNARGWAAVAALDEVAAAHDAPVAAVALAWLAAQPQVAAPIASATSTGQLAELLAMAELRLSSDELAALDRATAQ